MIIFGKYPTMSSYQYGVTSCDRLPTMSLSHARAGCALDAVTGHPTASRPLKPVTPGTVEITFVDGWGEDTVFSYCCSNKVLTECFVPSHWLFDIVI